MTSAAATGGSKIFGMENNIYYGRNGGSLAAGCEIKSSSMIAFKIAQKSTVKFYVRNSKNKSITDTWSIKSISNTDFSGIVEQYDAGGNAGTYYSNTNTELGTITITQGSKSASSTSGYTSVSVELSAGAYGFYLSSHSADGEFVDKVKITAAATTTHALAWNFDGGSCSATAGTDYTAAGQVAEGATITYPAASTMSKDGKDFAGWSSSATTMPNTDLTITALWQDPAPKFTVTYALNGPSGDAPTQAAVASGTVITLAAAPSWAGHAFDGWLCSADSKTKAAGSSYTMMAANTTFTAQWHELDCKIYSLTGGIGSAEKTADNASVTATQLQLSNNSGRIKLTPASGETFKAGDVVTISGTIGNGSSADFGVTIYGENGSTKIADVYAANSVIPRIATATLSADAGYVFLKRYGGTTTTMLTFEVHRSCAEGTAAGLSYAVTAINKMTGDAAFTNPLTNANGLVIAGYTSSNTAVATVDASNGQVTIVGDGTATITAHSAVQTKAGTLYAAGTATYTVTVTSASDDATLSALSVSGLTLSPTFAAATEDYTVTKAYGADDPIVADVTATPTSSEANAEVVWDGTNKKFVITVTAEDGVTKKTYNITVNEAEAPKSLSRVLFSNGFDAFIDNTNHTVKAYYLAGTAVPTATTITAGAGTAGEYAEGKITVTGADDSTVDYIVTLEAVTPNTTAVAEAAAAGEFAGNEAWVKNGLLIYGNAAGYDGGDGKKWYVNRRLKKGTDADDDQRVIAGWVRSYFFVGNASKFIMTVGGNRKLDYTIDGGTPVENVNVETLEIALTKGNHMIEIVSHQSDGDCRLSAPKLVELPQTFTVTYKAGEGTGDDVVDDDAAFVADCPNSFTAPEGKIFHSWKDGDDNDVAVGAAVTAGMTLTAQWIGHYAVTFNMQGHGAAIVAQDIVAGSKAVKPADPSEIGYDFGGWFTDAECTAGNEFDFNTAITVATELFAKWTAFDGCTLFYPATSGSAIAVGDAINKQTGSFGATMVAVSKDDGCTLEYASYGLSFAQSGNTSRVKVTLDHEIAIGTKITVTLVANGDKGSNRALDLYNSAVAKKAMLG